MLANVNRALGVTLVALFVLACAGSYNSSERLRDDVNLFNNAVRWGMYSKASRYVHEDDRRAWVVEHRGWGDDLQIADYEIVDWEFDEEEEDDETAIVRVVMSWYRLSENLLQTTMIAQRWQKDGRTWHMVGEEVEEGTPL